MLYKGCQSRRIARIQRLNIPNGVIIESYLLLFDCFMLHRVIHRGIQYEKPPYPSHEVAERSEVCIRSVVFSLTPRLLTRFPSTFLLLRKCTEELTRLMQTHDAILNYSRRDIPRLLCKFMGHYIKENLNKISRRKFNARRRDYNF